MFVAYCILHHKATLCGSGIADSHCKLLFFTAPNPVLGIATYIEHGMQISIFLYSMSYDLSC